MVSKYTESSTIMPQYRHYNLASSVFWLVALLNCVNGDLISDFFNEIPKTPTSISSFGTKLHKHCKSFLDCQSKMMDIHQKCTATSRRTTGEACGLTKDFRQLNVLMETRINEFTVCINNETDITPQDEFLETQNLPFKECDTVEPSVKSKIMANQGCWKALKQIKQQCQVLQKCCPAAKTCTKKGRNALATYNVRQKHIEINRRTLECRNLMRETLEKHREKNVSSLMLARAHAVLSLESATAVDTIQNKYVYDKNQRKQHKTTEEQNPFKLRSLSKGFSVRKNLPNRAEIVRRISQKARQNRNKKVLIINEIFVPPLTTKKMNVVVGDVTFKPSSTVAPTMANNSTLIPTKEQFRNEETRQVKTTKIPKTTTPTSTSRPITMSTTTSSLKPIEKSRLEQFQEFEELLSKLDAPTDTYHSEVPSTLALTANPGNMRHVYGIKTSSNSKAILPSDTKLDSHTPSPAELAQMQTTLQPQMLALPPTVNSTKLHVFEARPKLASEGALKFKVMQKRRRIRPTKQTTEMAMTTTAQRLRQHGTKMATGQIMLKKLKILHSKNTSKTADVNTEGMTTVHPTTADYDYRHQYDKQPTTIVKNHLVPSRKLHEKVTKKTDLLMVIFNKTSLQNVDTKPHLSQNNFHNNLKSTTVLSNTFSEHTIIPETVNFMKRKTGLQALKLTRHEEAEMMLVKKDLIKNLEMFVEKQVFDETLKNENQRLKTLRRSRQDPLAAKLSYCKLYSICNKQLKFLQKKCEDSSGRLVPGLPKRRFGDCNKRLVVQYKRVDKMRKHLDNDFDTCLTDRIASNNASTFYTCPQNWPVLPQFEEQHTCDRRKRIIQNHCIKLYRCCGAAQDCRTKLYASTLSQKLISKQEKLAEASAKCQIRAYNDYKKYQSTSQGLKSTDFTYLKSPFSKSS